MRRAVIAVVLLLFLAATQPAALVSMTTLAETQTPTATLTADPSTTPADSFDPIAAADISMPAGGSLCAAEECPVYVPIVQGGAAGAPVGTVGVASSRTYVDGTTRYIVGEVHNRTSQNAFSIEINARYYNAGGQLVDTDFTYAYVSTLQPDQRSPFKMLSFNAPTDITRYELSVRYRTSSIFESRPVTVVSQLVRTTNGNTEIVGEVRNDSGVALRSVQVYATFYDAAGAVLDVDFTYATPTELAVGATAAYKVLTFEDLSAAASVSVQAEGDVP